METVLITGGAGFIGSHLCDLLLSKGFRVIALDNLITGDLKNIEHLRNNENFTFVRHDVTNYIDIKEKLDYVLHLASPASPIDFTKIPIQIAKVGSLGTHNTLGLAKKNNAVFLLASTSEVYGDPKIHPQPESYHGNVSTTGIRGCYDESKRFAEAITMAYHRKHNINTKICRIFNTYGPKMRKDDGRVVPTFINQAINNQEITIFGDGKQTRSFCYVLDLINGMYKLMLSDINQPINLGNQNEMTIIDFAKKVLELTNSTSKIIFKDLPEDDPQIRQPDITKAKELLNWQPEVTLDEGLKKTVEYFKK